MIRNRLAIIALSICTAALLVPTASAQNDFSALYNRYLSHSTVMSARSAAMGGVYTALQGREMGLLGNPASVGLTEERFALLRGDYREVSSHIGLEDPGIPGRIIARDNEAEIWDVGGGVTYPFDWGGLGVMYDYRSDEVESDVFPTSIARLMQESDLERHNIALTGAYRVNEMAAVGYRYSYIDMDNSTDLMMVGPGPAANLATIEEEFSGHKNHAGVQYMMNEIITLGLDGYYGFGDYDTTGGDHDSDSYAIRGGAAWKYSEDYPLLVALDLNWENRELDGSGADLDDELWAIHLGAEYEVYDNFFLRAGYQMEDFDYQDSPLGIDESPSISTWSLGFGWLSDQFSVDYGFMYYDTGAGDMMHVVGLGYSF